MAETPMQGLSEWLRMMATAATTETFSATIVRWASEVEAACASLPAPENKDSFHLTEPSGEAAMAHLSQPCPCGISTNGDCAANTCAKVQRRIGWPPGLLARIKAAEQRVQDNRAPRSIPADPHSDVDLVLAEVRYLIEGRWPPFWIKCDGAAMSSAPPECKTEGERQAFAFGWWKALESQRNATVLPNCRWCDAPAGTDHHKSCPASVMVNGLTQAETDATASVFGFICDDAPAPDAIHDLIDKYWDLAYAEGKEGRTQDTKDWAAQRTRAEIDRLLRARHGADTEGSKSDEKNLEAPQ